MKIENPYLKVLKERYISLIVIPILAISLPVYYVNFKTISLTLYHVMVELPILILVIVQIFKLLIQITHKVYIEAFAQAVRLFVVSITIMLWWHYLSTSVTRTIERFEAKRDYYEREVAFRTSTDKDGKGKLIEFNLKPTGTVWRSIVYDETDTLLNVENKYRGLGNNFLPNEMEVIKIKPKFYYVRRYYQYEITPDVKNIEE